MRNEWTRSKECLGEMPAIRNKYTKELCLAGETGEIWAYSDDKCRVVLRAGKTQSRIFRILKKRGFRVVIKAVPSTESESVLEFPVSEVKPAARIINVPATLSGQIRFANTF